MGSSDRLIPRVQGVALALLLAVGAVACVSKPTMRLNHAEISGMQLATFPPSFGLLMTVVVDVYNPNGYDVAVRAMRGQVIMANKYTLPIDFRAPPNGFWMPAGQTTPLRVPVNMPLDLAVLLLREAFATPTIGYRVVGSADVTGTRTFQIEKDNYSVDELGTVTRDQIAGIIPASILATLGPPQPPSVTPVPPR